MQTINPLQLESLTPHELRIFNLAVQGLSLSAIQKETGLTAIAVQTSKIRQKLGGFRSTALMSAAYWRSRYAILEAKNKLLKYQSPKEMLTEDYKKIAIAYLNETPRLMSILYDLDLLPEQITDSHQEHFLFGAIAMFRLLREPKS